MMKSFLCEEIIQQFLKEILHYVQVILKICFFLYLGDVHLNNNQIIMD